MKYLEMLIGTILVVTGFFYATVGGDVKALDETNSVHYTNIEASDNVSVKKVDGLNIDYDADLEYPGDSYEVVFDIVNSSGVDMLIANCTWAEDTKFVDYDLRYVEDGKKLEKGDLIKKGETRKVVYKVTYKDDVISNEDVKINTGFAINFEQAF